MGKRIKDRIRRSLSGWFVTVLGTVALMGLVSHGFKYGFSPTLQLILNSYEDLTRYCLEWAEPYIKEWIIGLRDFIPWDLTLYSHWRDIFLLMMLYFSARLKAAWNVGEYAAATFLLAVGFPLAIVASVAAGTVPLQPGADQKAISLLVAAFPAAGVLIFDFLEIIWSSIFRHRLLVETLGNLALTRRQIFFKLAHKVLVRFVFSAVVILMWTQMDQLPVLRDVPSPGLVVLLFLIVATSFYWLYQGLETTRAIRRSTKRDSKDRETTKDRVSEWWRRGSTRVGWLILRPIGGLLLIICISAGEKYLGR